MKDSIHLEGPSIHLVTRRIKVPRREHSYRLLPKTCQARLLPQRGVVRTSIQNTEKQHVALENALHDACPWRI